MKKILFCISIMLSATATANPNAYDKTTDYKKIGWMDKGMEQVKAKLKDPESAQFSGVYFHRGADGVPMTCGKVNAKNSFGGYTGSERFFSAGKPHLTFLESQVDGFPGLWSKFCQ